MNALHGALVSFTILGCVVLTISGCATLDVSTIDEYGSTQQESAHIAQRSHTVASSLGEMAERRQLEASPGLGSGTWGAESTGGEATGTR